MNCPPIFSNFFSDEKCESFVGGKRYFFSSIFDVEMDKIFGLKNDGSGSYYYFVLQVNEASENEMFLSSENESESETDNENKNEGIVSEKDEIGELLKLSGGSKMKGFSGFSERKLRNVIRIEDSVEIIRKEAFNGDESLKKVIFSISNQLRRFVVFVNAHHFFELKFLHRLKKSENLVC
jgi:hypothetical protein